MKIIQVITSEKMEETPVLILAKSVMDDLLAMSKAKLYTFWLNTVKKRISNTVKIYVYIFSYS